MTLMFRIAAVFCVVACVSNLAEGDGVMALVPAVLAAVLWNVVDDERE